MLEFQKFTNFKKNIFWIAWRFQKKNTLKMYEYDFPSKFVKFRTAVYTSQLII